MNINIRYSITVNCRNCGERDRIPFGHSYHDFINYVTNNCIPAFMGNCTHCEKLIIFDTVEIDKEIFEESEERRE